MIIYVAIVGGGMTLGVIAIERGHPPAIVVGVLGAAAIVAVAILERVRPHVPAWNRSRGDLFPDSLHMLVSGIATTQLASMLLGAGDGRPWPTAWPLAAQLPLALVLGEFGQYWAHRLLHERPVGWRVHAIHHSAERLYWLNGTRNHPLDVLFQYTGLMAPLVLLGAGADVLALVSLFPAIHTPLQHSNVAVRPGLLSYVLATAELHRWHHAPGATGNINYGGNLVLWDQIFGTYRRPSAPCTTVGLEDRPDFPRRYLEQLLAPFRIGR